MNLTHLHLHTEYSQLDGHGSPESYVKRAKALGMDAIAITDHGCIDGALELQKQCEKHGLDPIIGCELYVVPDMMVKQKGDRRGHITVLVAGIAGYHALLRILSKAYIDGFYYRPRIGFRDILKEEGIEDLYFLTGCCESFLNLKGGMDFLTELVGIGANVALEVMPIQIRPQIDHNRRLLDLSMSDHIPLVASADCHYVLKKHAITQEVMLAIRSKAKWNDKDRWSFTSSHLKSHREMCSEFDAQGVLTRRQYLSALSYTNIIAEKCRHFRIPELDIQLPMSRYEREWKDLTADQILYEFCQQGKKEIFDTTVFVPSKYQERLNRELDLIKRKGFARYFLIVKEIVDWCKEEGIMVGPGRGSVGGSLIALLLGITKVVDPIRYGLLFERFISEDRIDYPDIDLDFENIKCDRVREHLEEEYGKTHVAGISTFLRLQSKASVRDVGRVFEVPAKEIDVFAKAIRPKEHAENIIENSGNDLKEGQIFKSKYPKEFDIMVSLEGTIKTAGQHPAGLIVSKDDLMTSDRCHVLKRKDKLVINWDMDNSEKAGLMKIDILKLDTLTVLQEARRLLSLQGTEIEYEKLPLDDVDIYRRMAKGDLEGIFQLSGWACAKLCKKISIDNIEDVAAIISLARPGPADSGMTDDYVARKKGKTWEPLHPKYEEITRETYGIIAYQEQMMRAMTDLAGFSGDDADRIRKVIGKKRKAKEFEPYRVAFLEGCAKMKTLTESQAATFWKGLLEWAHYGFNKSHAIEYAIIAYWTAYMKYKHPVEFICAQLSYGSNKEKMVQEAKDAGLQVVTPKIGISEPINWISKDGMLYMPFIEINGVGEIDAGKCPTKKKPIPKKHGFFSLEELGLEEEKYKDSLTKLLDQVKAFDPSPSAVPDDCLTYFQYEITPPECQIQDEMFVAKRQAIIDKAALDCKECKLRKEASQVVLSSKGIYNAMVIAGAPGKQEDKKGQGLVGQAGMLFWDEMKRYEITRRMLHYGSVCKCWPSKTKNPHRGHINTCFNKWMVEEVKSMDCKLILAMGNPVLFAVHGESGITNRSGTIEYIPKLKAWVVWCVGPSAVLRNQKYYEPMFKKGIEAFATKFIQLKR